LACFNTFSVFAFNQSDQLTTHIIPLHLQGEGDQEAAPVSGQQLHLQAVSYLVLMLMVMLILSLAKIIGKLWHPETDEVKEHFKVIFPFLSFVTISRSIY
jgi:hypothetical protein